MVMKNVPVKKFRLQDGELGTEYEAVLECIKLQEARLRLLEEDIELLKIRLRNADGHP